MIRASDSSIQTDFSSNIPLVVSERLDYKNELAGMAKTVPQLLLMLGWKMQELPYELDIQPNFQVRATDSFISRIDKSNYFDPLVLQILPLKVETQKKQGFTDNPLNEDEYQVAPGLIHKYNKRVLMVSNGVCAINCRYCFRRSFPYDQHKQASSQWQQAYAWLSENTDIEELILSGGDPLMNVDSWFEKVVTPMLNLDHIKRLRIHTRIPMVLPSRINDSWLTWISSLPSIQKIMVLHINHANEMDEAVMLAIKKLQTAGFRLFNQAVLLKGVNDNATELADLMQTLFDQGVQPYYLHLLDKVSGSHHFEVDLEQAKIIFSQLRAILPGYMMPQLAQEVPDRPYKSIYSCK